jgi:hypothetical protein
VPTLVERVYANRFATAEKTIWTLYNARGFTVEAPLLEVPAAPNAHYFDLLQCKELPLVKSGDKPALALKLPRNRTACIARLPRLLSIRRAPNALEVTVTPQGEKLLLTLASQDGNVLIQREARAGINVLALPPSDQNAPPPACVKLLKEGFLLDAVELPAP